MDSKSARPLVPNGFKDASDDPEVIATWFSGEYASARVGVWAGGSGLVIADLDRKNNKDGFQAVDEAWLDLPETFSYQTPNGGEHRFYRAPEGKRLTGNADYRGLVGFDRRAGGSYVVFHGDAAPTWDEIADAPDWLCDEATEHVSEGFSGTITDWLNEFGQGEPTGLVQRAIDRIKTPDMSHSDMVEDQYNLIRLGAEGAEGVGVALEALRSAWLSRPPEAHSTPQEDWNFKFDEALESGIAKFGDEVASIASLPPYQEALDAALSAEVDDRLIIGTPQPKASYHRVIEALTRTEMTDEQVASVVWSAPTVKAHARDWGVDYLYETIADKRSQAVALMAPRENPSLTAITNAVDSAYADNAAPVEYPLLTDDERQVTANWATWTSRYLAWVQSRTKYANMPYHRSAALTCMSLMSGMYCFLPEDEGTLGTNFFNITLGPSGSGKSRAMKFRRAVLSEFFYGDQGYNLGSNASMEALHEVLLKRDNKASFFHSDEADTVIEVWMVKDYAKGISGRLTDWFEGHVEPMLRRGQTDDERRGAVVSLDMALWGTEDALVEKLTEKMFKSGFLARPVWFLGDPKIQTDERFKVSTGSAKRAEAEYDGTARSLALDFVVARKALGRRKPMLETPEAIKRLEKAKKSMHLQLEHHPRWAVLEPSLTRLGDSIRKFAALTAFSAGRRDVLLPDMLVAIEQAEEWMRNLVRVSEGVVASEFQREVDEVERVIIAAGGTMKMTVLMNKFRRWTPKDALERIGSLEAQARINMNGNRDTVVINTGQGVK